MLTSLLRIILTRSIKPFVFSANNKKLLDYSDLDNLGLYVHIPFCEDICSFCPYCKVKYNEKLKNRYKVALLEEIELVCKGNNKKKVNSLYFGGGTPALMIDEMKQIIDKLSKYFIIEGGIGVELHPRDIRPEILTKLKDAGVTMVSVGIQSFDKHCLDKIGRKYADYKSKLKLVNEFKFDVIDVDLIFGIPGQNARILKKDMSTAFELGATQVSTYPFIDFTYANNEYKPLSEKHKRRMLNSLNHIGKSLGVERTSVWTFAKKGSDKYSSVTRESFLGFGVSATSLLKKSFKINTFSINGYIDRIKKGKLPTSLTINFTPRQRAVYFMFWSAYSLRISKKRFRYIVGEDINKMYGLELWLCTKLGLLTYDGENYYLSDKSAYLYHYVEQRYTTAYIDKMWNISRKQAFPKKIVLK